MAISIASINPPPSSTTTTVVSNAAAPFVNDAQPSPDRQPSAVVNLSTQGQQLSQVGQPINQAQANPAQANQNQTANAANTANAVHVNMEPQQTKEIAAPPGIRFMEGESKGGRVNTFA